MEVLHLNGGEVQRLLAIAVLGVLQEVKVVALLDGLQSTCLGCGGITTYC